MKWFLFLCCFVLSSRAAETQLTDNEGGTAYLYTPGKEPEKGKVYWLAIGVHGAGGDGKGACGIADWAKEDVIVLGPSFSQLGKPNGESKDKPLGMSAEAYQMAGAAHVEKLNVLIAEVGKTWKLHPKIFLHGFSAGAQFVHRFAMKRPEIVAGVSAASAGTWSTRGYGEINVAAASIPFAVSCGEYDRQKSMPDAPLNRIDWMRDFATELRKAHFDVAERTITNVGHNQNEDTIAFAKSCFARARAVNFSPTVMLALDFNDDTPLFDLSAAATQNPEGNSVTAMASWDRTAGTVEKEASAEHTGALRLRVSSLPAAKTWSGSMSTGLLPVHCVERDMARLTLAFDLSASSPRPVRVRIESFDAAKKRTGGLEGLAFPAAPCFYHRQSLDLRAMKTVGEGAFQASDPFVQISFSISDDLGWAATSGHELRVDNLGYAAPAFFVSPSGDDKVNNGRSADKSFATPQRALNLAKAGDVIMLMDGTYTNDRCVAQINGTGAPAAWLVLRACPGQKPVLRSTWWDCVKIGQGSKTAPSTAPGTAYVEVRGLTIHGFSAEVEEKYKDKLGKSEPQVNSNGFSVEGRFQAERPHHLRIADMTVFDCPGGGISVIRADRVSIENNESHHNCKWMIYAGSGISILEPANFENTPGEYRLLLRNNRTHDNACTQPWIATGKLSDGNGLILDTLRGAKNDPLAAAFHGRTLVQGNLSYRNGGSGMHAFASDHVDFINNTCVGNNTVMDYSQLGITQCSDCRVLNNLLVAPHDKPVNRVNGQFSDIVVSHNLFWGGNGQQVPGDQPLVADPMFNNADADDFHLKPQSPAIGTGGLWEISPSMTLDGRLLAPSLAPVRGAL